jgi:dolichyl-phosphate-mannose--protein O-mannosyl transferase
MNTKNSKLFQTYSECVNEAKFTTLTYYVYVEYVHRDHKVHRNLISINKVPKKYFNIIIHIDENNNWKLKELNKEKYSGGMSKNDSFDLIAKGSDLKSLHTASPLGYEAIKAKLK